MVSSVREARLRRRIGGEQLVQAHVRCGHVLGQQCPRARGVARGYGGDDLLVFDERGPHAHVARQVLQARQVQLLHDAAVGRRQRIVIGRLDGHAGQRVAALPDRPRRALVKALNDWQTKMNASASRRDVQAYYRANLAFHWAIIEAADNDALSLTYRGIVQQLHLSRLKNLSRDVGMRASLIEHKQIIATIAAGDTARAQALLAEHVTASHVRLSELLATDVAARATPS